MNRMKDQNKTKAQLIKELEETRHRVSELEKNQSVSEQTELALRESERRYRLLAENITDVIWTMDLGLNSTYTSPSVRRLRGFDAEDAMSQSLAEAMTPDSLEVASKALEEELAKENLSDKDLSRSRTLEFEIFCKDGSTIWVETTMTFMRDADGQPTEILGITRDITERKQAAEMLKESEQRFRALVESGKDEIVVLDSQLKPIYMSPAVLRTSDYSWGQMAETVPFSGVYSEDQTIAKGIYDRLLRNPEQDVEFQLRLVRKNGSLRWTEGIASNLLDNPSVRGLVLNYRDITERVEAEQALQESEQRFLVLSAAAFEGIVISDKGKVVDANEQLAAMLGYDPLEMTGLAIDKFVAPESLELVRRHIQSDSELPYEHLAMRKDGSTFPVEIRAKSLPYQGRILRVTAIRDITDRKQTEGMLRLQSAALEAAANGIIITDINGNIQWINPAFTQLTGFGREEALGKNPRELVFSGVQDSTFYKNFWDTILSGRVWHGELVNCRKDGTLYHEEMTLTPLKNEKGEITHFIAVKQDISERKQGEDDRSSLARFPSENPNPVMRLRHDGRILYANDASLFFLAEWNCQVGDRAPDFWSSLVEDALSKEVTQNIEIQHREQVFSFSIAPINDAGYVNLYGKNITERKRTEQALNDSRSQLAGVIDSAMDAIITLDSEQRIILFNPAAETLFRCPVEEVIGQTLNRFIPERYGKTHREQINNFGETNQTSRSMGVGTPVVCLRADGEEFIAEITISQSEMAEQKIYTAILRDISGRIQAEQALKKSEEHFRALFEHLPIPAFTKDLDGRYTSSNAANQRYWAVNPTGKTDSELLSPKAAELLRAIDAQVIKTGNTLTREESFESTPLGKRQFISRKVPLRDGSDKIIGILGANVDITERKRADEALSKRVEELGALYATTLEIISAHDLSGLLNSIVMRAVDLLGGSSGGLYLCNSEKEQVRCVVSYQTKKDYTGTVLKFGEGAAGTVASTGEPLIIANYRTWEGRADVFEEDKPFTAMISAPMLWKGKVTGVIHVRDDTKEREFTEEDLKLLLSFANQAAIAVENTHLLEETQRSLERLSTLRHIDQAISSSLDLRVTLNILLGHILQQLEVDAAAVLLYRQDLQMLEFVAGEGFHTQALQFTTLRLGEGFAGQAVLEQRTVHITDLSLLEDGFLRSPKFRNENFVAYIGVPLIAKGYVVGVLEIYHRQSFKPEREWMVFLETLAGQAAIAIDNVRLFEDLQASNMQLRQAHDATIEGWASVLEMRNIEAEGHSRRVADLTVELARKLGIGEKELEHVRWGALLHDIGKMGVPDTIIQKPGPLTEEEWDLIRQHPGFAKKWLSPILYLKDALDIPYCHHEKWDGTGYPRGLKGEQIPLAARIFAVVDVWDALRSDRSFRDAWPLDKVITYVREQSGVHFDPEVLDAFFDLLVEKKFVVKNELDSLNRES